MCLPLIKPVWASFGLNFCLSPNKRVQRTEQVLLNSGAIARNDFDKQKSEATAAKAALGATKIKLERMQAQIAKAQAQVAQAKVKIQRLKVIESYKVITSPMTGIVQERMADPGVVVQPGMGILKIGDYSKVRLQANVAQQNLAGVEIGSPVVARVIGNATKTIKGRVTSIFPKAGEETRTVTVEAVVDNPGGQILAGQAVEMQIMTAHKPNALSVSQAAVTESEGKQAVWVVEGKSAKRKFITTGLTSGDRVEVTSGLQSGDLVITSGQERLVENASVAAVDDSGQPVASLSSAVQGNTQIKLVSPQGKAVSGA
jgi:RND family efflux transporter MFP subunit